jgi:hypothetical protein
LEQKEISQSQKRRTEDVPSEGDFFTNTTT